MPNGQLYTYVETDRPVGYNGYFRQAGALVFRYSTLWQVEEILYDFSKTTHDTVTVRYYPNDTLVVIVVYDRTVNVFGRERRQWGFWEQSSRSSFYVLYEVTDSLGLTVLQFEPGIHFRLMGCVVNGVQYGTISGIARTDSLSPKRFVLQQNFPNPFNPSTKIVFTVGMRQFVTLKVYDLLGKEVANLVNEELEAGSYEILWDARHFANGAYHYKLQAGNFIDAKKLLILK